MPGDLDQNGMIGYRPYAAPADIEKQPYTSSDFKYPYNGSVDGYGIPNQITSPFVELYLEKIFDFEPRNVSETNVEKMQILNSLPSLKTFSDYYILPIYRVGLCQGENDWRCNMISGNYIEILTQSNDENLKMARIIKSIDQKIDDGFYNYGSFFSECNYNQILEEKKGYCRAFDYRINL